MCLKDKSVWTELIFLSCGLFYPMHELPLIYIGLLWFLPLAFCNFIGYKAYVYFLTHFFVGVNAVMFQILVSTFAVNFYMWLYSIFLLIVFEYSSSFPFFLSFLSSSLPSFYFTLQVFNRRSSQPLFLQTFLNYQFLL